MDVEEPGRQHDAGVDEGDRKSGALADLVTFLKQNTRWWLLPFLLVVALLVILAVMSSSASTPFVYTLF